MKKLTIRMALILYLLAQLGAQNSAQTAAGGNGKSAYHGECGRIYGKSDRFMFCAPKGWTLDVSIGNEEGIHAAFYPDGSSWDSAKQSGTVMYIKTSEKKDESATVKQFMAFDADEVKRIAPSAVVKKGKTIQVGYLDVPVRLFAPGISDRFEAAAYIESPKVITMFVISSKDQDNIKRNYRAFVQFVQSYHLLGTGVVTQNR